MADCGVPNRSSARSSCSPVPGTPIRRLTLLDDEQFRTDVRHVDVGEGVRVSVITWGGPVELEMEQLRDRYLVTVPLAGQIEVRTRCHTVMATSECAAIIDPRDETRQRWSSDAAAIWLHLACRFVELEAEHIGKTVGSAASPQSRNVRFQPNLCLSEPGGREWVENLWCLVELLDDQERVSGIAPHRLTVLRRELAAGLLHTARADE